MNSVDSSRLYSIHRQIPTLGLRYHANYIEIRIYVFALHSVVVIFPYIIKSVVNVFNIDILISVVLPNFLLANLFNLLVLLLGFTLYSLFYIFSYSSSGAKSNPRACNLATTSSKDFLPKFLTFIISDSVLFAKSSTVEIPARFRQLNDLTDNSNSSIDYSRILSFLFSSFSIITFVFLVASDKSINNSRCPVNIFAAKLNAS